MKIKRQNRAVGYLPGLFMVAGITLFFATLAIGVAYKANKGATSKAISIQDHNSTHDKLFWKTSYEDNDILQSFFVVNTRTGDTSKLSVPGSSTIISNSEEYRVFAINDGRDRELLGTIENGTLN